MDEEGWQPEKCAAEEERDSNTAASIALCLSITLSSNALIYLRFLVFFFLYTLFS